jgi:hypothetical protein
MTQNFMTAALATIDPSASLEDEARGRLAEFHDPEKFSRDVLGALPFSRDQRRFLRDVVDVGPAWWALLGGNGAGKTAAIAFAALYLFGPAACRRGADGKPVGCTLLLTAPKSTAARATIYHQVVGFGAEAAGRGLPLPGWRARPADRYPGASSASVLWHADRNLWEMRILSAARQAGRGMAHGTSGAHARGCQVIIEEEGEGVLEEVQTSVAGLAVASNVFVFCATNPTNRRSHLAARIADASASWRQLSFPVYRHPNILERRDVVPGAASHKKFEDALRSAAFERRGLAGETTLKPARLDFVYALAPAETPDKPGPRDDGIPGHPDAEPQAFRPATGLAAGMWCGDWLRQDDSRLLFAVGAIQAAMAASRWSEPDRHPTRVGFDCAQGTRSPIAVPSWGAPACIAVEAGADKGAIVCGLPVELDWTGSDRLARARSAATAAARRWGTTPLYVGDTAFGGEVAAGLAAAGCRVEQVDFGAKPVGEPIAVAGTMLYGKLASRRVEMHAHAAAALNAGIAVLPWSPKLLAQMERVGDLLHSDGPAGAKLAPKGEDMDELDALVLSLEAASRAAQSTTFSPWG